MEGNNIFLDWKTQLNKGVTSQIHLRTKYNFRQNSSKTFLSDRQAYLKIYMENHRPQDSLKIITKKQESGKNYSTWY